MKKLTEKVVGLILGFTAVVAVIVVFAQTNVSFSKLKANTHGLVLNSSNSPTLINGEGTMLDNKGITWEYHNASNYNSGHVTLNTDSYVGVSHNSNWGVTAISSITPVFSGSELWLLKSTDGIEWHEAEILTSGQESFAANDWRYIRFYNYSSSVNINSISIDYSCAGISATEDIDSAHVSNVITTTGLTASSEYSDISPNSVSGEAVRFTKEGTSSTDLTIGFNRAYTLGEVAYSKIEFDMWTANVNYGRTIEVLNTNGSYTSSKITTSTTNSYVWTSLGNNWYHVELPITTIVSLISGYDKKDIPEKNVAQKAFNAIRLNAGACIIDNLRIGSSECNLGIYNSSSYKPSVGEIYWVKTSWVGKLYAEDVDITFSDDTLARRIPLTDPKLKNGSPFYIELLDSGTLTIYVSVVCGYNHRTQTISKTITIK